MMKRKMLTIALIGAATIFASCKGLGKKDNGKYPGFTKTTAGLYYKFVANKSGTRQAKIGDIATLLVQYKIASNDSLIWNSAKVTPNFRIRVAKPAYNGDFMEGIAMMSIGDSAIFITSADSFFAKVARSPMPKFVKPGSDLKFDVKLVNTQTQKELEAANAKEAKDMATEEQAEIQKYLKDSNIKATPTKSGLYYIEEKKGTGPLAKAGDVVSVNYKGTLLDGKIFDSSYKRGKPITFPLGQHRVIPGWDEALTYMRKGGKAKLIIPSNLAYGSRQAGPMIKPYSVLIFDIVLEDIKKGTAQPAKPQFKISPVKKTTTKAPAK